MYAAGFSFFVLTDGFFIHDGFNELENLSQKRIAEATENIQKFRKFVLDLVVKYRHDDYEMLAKIVNQVIF